MGVTNRILKDLCPSHFAIQELSLFRLVPIPSNLLTFAPSSSDVFMINAFFQRAVVPSLRMVACLIYSMDFKNDSEYSEGKEDRWSEGVTCIPGFHFSARGKKGNSRKPLPTCTASEHISLSRLGALVLMESTQAEPLRRKHQKVLL